MRWLALVGLVVIGGCSPVPKTAPVPRLVGAWNSKVQFSDGPFAAVRDLELLYSFNLGGTMTESSNYDENQPVPPAYGVWKEAAANEFDATYTYYNTKPPKTFDEIAKTGGWLPAGKGILKEHIKLAADGDIFESKITFDLYDKDGKHIDGGGSAAGHGTRVKLQ